MSQAQTAPRSGATSGGAKRTDEFLEERASTPAPGQRRPAAFAFIDGVLVEREVEEPAAPMR